MISALKFCFSDFGIPEEIICDNGPQFTSREYQDFAAKYGSKLTTSSPFYPKGHGYIERQIQSIKNLLKKCDEDKSDPHLALLQLRTTPNDNRTPSPSQLLQNRQLRMTLPAIIRPPPDSEQVRASLQSRQVFNHHDAHTKEHTKLLPTQPVCQICHWSSYVTLHTGPLPGTTSWVGCAWGLQKGRVSHTVGD